MPQPNMQQLLQQAQKMQQEMLAAQESLKDEVVEASAGGGMVTVRAAGDLSIRSITIDPEAVDPSDLELLQDMVLAAVNEALRMAQELVQARRDRGRPWPGRSGTPRAIAPGVRPTGTAADQRALEAAGGRRPNRAAARFSPLAREQGGCAVPGRRNPRGEGAH